ncbi:MAG: hypothetical protein ABIH83_02265 [Candidatus Micrarchaeota archaeon]
MGKKGKSPHTKRIALPRALPVKERKAKYWLVSTSPGPHSASRSMSLAMLLRDELQVCASMKEVEKVLNSGAVLVDGKARRNEKRPVGIMDIISIPKMEKAWRLQMIGGKLRAKEIPPEQAKIKFCKITGKRTERGKKLMLTLHDGRNLPSDNNAKVGSTLKMSVPEFKILSSLPLDAGAKCVVIRGKHAGKLATLEKIQERAGSMEPESMLKSPEGEFTTLTKYLIAVDKDFE